MLFILSVLAGTGISILFKWYEQWKITVINAIVINYTFCLVLGLVFEGQRPDTLPEVFHKPWFSFVLLLGFLFMIGFNLTAYCIQRFGITPTVLMQKMSIVLTVAFTVFVFHERMNWIEMIGLLLAMSAIIAITLGKGSEKSHSKWRLIILGALWVIAALVEVVLFYVEHENIVGDDHQLFTTLGFGTAGIIGWIYLITSMAIGKNRLQWKDVLAGLILSIPNYFSVYLLLMLLNLGWKGSILYPLLNVCVLLLSTLAAYLLFSEKLSIVNRIGVALAILAILIIAFAQNFPL